MCGIMGYIGKRQAGTVLLNGLKRLEYRGYDSAGIAVLNGQGLEVRRRIGKLSALESLLKDQPAKGTLGLGHTRWATHGRPTEENAHPHACCQGTITVVHNGIIENYAALKAALSQRGHLFKSQTDTEVIAHLIEEAGDNDLFQAVRSALKHIRGSYAIGVVSSKERERVIAARKDSPLVIGVGDREMFLASDVPALLPYTREVIFLKDGEIAQIRRDAVYLFNEQGKEVSHTSQTVSWDAAMVERGNFKHYMLKEIYEQPQTVINTCHGRLSRDSDRIELDDILPQAVAQSIRKICLVGCGTSYHSALIARFWMEEIADLPCEVDMASEYRYRRGPKDPDTLVVAITQSGETADTLVALREAQVVGHPTLAICNAVGSTASREATHTFYTVCGPEIGVASTKAFIGQLTALFLLALYLAQSRSTQPLSVLRPLQTAFLELPNLMQKVLAQAPDVEKVAERFQRWRNFLYLGRHVNYPIALEGALKLKEISYIHAEGYPAGEMKHGPIALVEEGLPVVTLATQSFVRDKMLSNMEEIKARGGSVIGLVTEQDEETIHKSEVFFKIPAIHEFLSPFLNVIPLQLLAYYIADKRGCDVDQPRNLAKSVTVE